MHTKPIAKILAVLFFVMLTLTLLTVLVAAGTGTIIINRSVLGNGGAPASSGTVSLNGTLGQPIAGESNGENVSLGSGFWYAGSYQGSISEGHSIFLPLVDK